MMGRQQRVQKKLFYTKFSLDQRVPENHILRKFAKYIDFNFIYKEVKDKYGSNGNVSIPPPVILKMMLLLVFYNVRSKRELMATIPVRLDWLWFLGYDLDDEVPNHSVLSKARTRWGVSAFRSFFDRIVIQCVHAGLVDGSKLFMDSSNIQADASNNSVVNKEDMNRYLKKSYRLFEQRLEKKTPTTMIIQTLPSLEQQTKNIFQPPIRMHLFIDREDGPSSNTRFIAAWIKRVKS